MYHAYLFLVVFDSEFESRQVVVALLVQQVDVVSVVEDHFQLSGASCLVQEVLGKLFTLLRQLLILRFELVLHLRKHVYRIQIPLNNVLRENLKVQLCLECGFPYQTSPLGILCQEAVPSFTVTDNY